MFFRSTGFQSCCCCQPSPVSSRSHSCSSTAQQRSRQPSLELGAQRPVSGKRLPDAFSFPNSMALWVTPIPWLRHSKGLASTARAAQEWTLDQLTQTHPLYSQLVVPRLPQSCCCLCPTAEPEWANYYLCVPDLPAHCPSWTGPPPQTGRGRTTGPGSTAFGGQLPAQFDLMRVLSLFSGGVISLMFPSFVTESEGTWGH